MSRPVMSFQLLEAISTKHRRINWGGGRDVHAIKTDNVKVMVNQTKVGGWNEGKMIGKKRIIRFHFHIVESYNILSLLYVQL